MSWSKAVFLEFAIPMFFAAVLFFSIILQDENMFNTSMMGLILSLQLIILLWLRTLIIIMKKVIEALAEYSAALAEIRIKEYNEEQLRREAGIT